jgi:type I restriction-modification system DNA methylase subunit
MVVVFSGTTLRVELHSLESTMAEANSSSKLGKQNATIGFEAKLWLTADKLGNNMDVAQYKAENVFWLPSDARWSHLQASAKQPTIGKLVDDAMVAIERDNARLKGVLPKDYARPGLDKQRLGELIDVIATIELTAASEGEKTFCGFCKSATTAEIAAHGHVLTPGRYVGAEEVADDGDPFEEKMPRLVAELAAQFAESAKLEQAINANLKGFGYVL